MTALQLWKAKSEEIIQKKKLAIINGERTITYTDHNDKQHTLYYHSGRWNDRTSKIGQYNR